MKLGRIVTGLAATVAVVMGVTACGGSTGASTGEASGPSGGGSRTIGVVNLTGASEPTTAAANAVKLGGAKLGWRVRIGDGEGDPTKYSQIMQQYVNDHVDAIFTVSIEAPTIAPQLAAAKKAGIPVIAVGYEVDPATASQFDAVYAPDYKEAGKALAEKAIADGAKPGTVLAQTQPGGSSVSDYVEGALEALKTDGFKAYTAPVDVKNFQPSVQSTSRSLLQSHPEAKLFVGCCSISTATILSDLDSLKRSDVTVMALFDTSDVLDKIRAGAPVLLAAPDYVRGSFIGLDQLRKHWADGASIDPHAGDGKFTYKVIDKSNVPASGPVFPVAEVAKQYFAQWAASASPGSHG